MYDINLFIEITVAIMYITYLNLIISLFEYFLIETHCLNTNSKNIKRKDNIMKNILLN